MAAAQRWLRDGARGLRERLRALVDRSPLLAAAGLFLGGIVAWGAFNTGMEATNTLPFCISCHEMRSTVYEEYRHTVHFSNPSGVQATCPDCHVPKDWTAKLVRKIRASNEVFHWALGSISTKEKFEARRPELARRVWAGMKASDSQECRNCHNFKAMNMAGQSRFAKRLHEQASAAGQTCIDCHKGISHQLPSAPKSVAAAEQVDPDLAQSINQTCAPCHGREGQGTADGTYPRLAGLDPTYLATQIAHFKVKERINIPMAPFATDRELPEEDVRAITQYLGSIELPRKLAGDVARPTDALALLQQSKATMNVPLYPGGDVGRGRRLYDKECAACHARDGYGDRSRTVPQLAGQHSLYLKRQIADFANGVRNHDHPADAAIFASLTESDVADVLAYLSTLDD